MIARLFTTLQVLLMGALLMGGMSAVAEAQTPPPGGMGGTGGHMRHWDPAQMQARMKAHLAKLHERLEIKASQESAWEAFAKSIEALPMGMDKTKRPGPDADAATLARFRAERAQAFAKKMGVIADTSAKLESVLTPSQRKVFDNAARHYGHHRFGHGGDHCDHHGGHMGGKMGGARP